MSEALLQKSIIQWMQFSLHPNVVYFHPANGEWRTIVTARRLKGMGVIPGIPDIIVFFPPGKSLCLEVKMPSGRISESQHHIHAKLQWCGIPVEIVRSLDDVIEAVKRHGVPLRADVARAA